MDPSDSLKEVEAKGITTIYQGLFPVVSVNKQGVARPLKNRQPKWSRVKVVHYIQGQTLNRLSVIEGLGTRHIRCAVRQVNAQQRESQCDDCIRLHRPTNKNCSATLGIRSNATDPTKLYKWTTKKAAGVWKTDLEQFGGRDRVGVVELSRVS